MALIEFSGLTKRYGATFLQSLPECSVAVGSALELPAAAERWLEAAKEGVRVLG